MMVLLFSYIDMEYTGYGRSMFSYNEIVIYRKGCNLLKMYHYCVTCAMQTGVPYTVCPVVYF